MLNSLSAHQEKTLYKSNILYSYKELYCHKQLG